MLSYITIVSYFTREIKSTFNLPTKSVLVCGTDAPVYTGSSDHNYDTAGLHWKRRDGIVPAANKFFALWIGENSNGITVTDVDRGKPLTPSGEVVGMTVSNLYAKLQNYTGDTAKVLIKY